jgi:hypothetical protein
MAKKIGQFVTPNLSGTDFTGATACGTLMCTDNTAKVSFLVYPAGTFAHNSCVDNQGFCTI